MASNEIIYAKAAQSNTAKKPTSNAIIRASPALTTDMAPLMPQAQGTSFSSDLEIILRPIGNKNPIKKEGMNKILIAMMSFGIVFIPILTSNM